MHRRQFMGSAAALLSASSLSAPALAQGQAARTLRFVPQADLSGMDPIITTRQVVRNGAFLVWDMLYGAGADGTPRPQMCAGHEVDAEGKVWTFTLRPGLKFHDNEPVRAIDAVASIQRWIGQDVMGRRLQLVLAGIEVIDDLKFRLRLNRPFPKLLQAFAKVTTNILFVMPERIAKTDRSRNITEFVGSGPMVFKRDEWNVGARAAFEKFAGYSPAEGPTDWLAGAKRMLVDRIEWITMPDPSTAAAALRQGEIDWWEQPIPDLATSLRSARGVRIDISDPLGNVALLRFNWSFAPFTNVSLRRAFQAVVNQEDYMGAVVGGDPQLWKPMPSFFTPGTPAFTEVGSEPMKRPRDMNLAKRLIAESGYSGETIVLPVATDVPVVKAQGEITADLMQQMGLKVDFLAMDWGAHSTRTASKQPAASGGWHVSHTWVAGAECANPAGHKSLDGSGGTSTNGWAKSEEVDTQVNAWFDATTAPAEKAAIDAANRAAMETVLFIPTGFFLNYTAWRQNVSGIVKAPFPCFWGVSKS